MGTSSAVRAVVAAVALVLAGCGTVRPPAPAPVLAVVSPPDLQPGMVPAAPQGKPLLTVTGRIATTNAPGATLALDRATLDRLGVLALSVDDPWAKQRMALQGVRLRDLVALARPAPAATTLHLRALDDYQVDLSLADVRADDIVLATRNGQGTALALEDGGPTRVVFPDDLAGRFSRDLWIWNIDTIEVR